MKRFLFFILLTTSVCGSAHAGEFIDRATDCPVVYLESGTPIYDTTPAFALRESKLTTLQQLEKIEEWLVEIETFTKKYGASVSAEILLKVIDTEIARLAKLI